MSKYIEILGGGMSQHKMIVHFRVVRTGKEYYAYNMTAERLMTKMRKYSLPL